MTIVVAETPTPQSVDWPPLFAAAMRVGKFSSVNELYLRALNAWLEQLSPVLRWDIAIELYTHEEVSSGRAAEIAGLNYFVFMEKLAINGIPFMAAASATGEQSLKEEVLLNELFDFSRP